MKRHRSLTWNIWFFETIVAYSPAWSIRKVKYSLKPGAWAGPVKPTIKGEAFSFVPVHACFPWVCKCFGICFQSKCPATFGICKIVDKTCKGIAFSVYKIFSLFNQKQTSETDLVKATYSCLLQLLQQLFFHCSHQGDIWLCWIESWSSHCRRSVLSFWFHWSMDTHTYTHVT